MASLSTSINEFGIIGFEKQCVAQVECNIQRQYKFQKIAHVLIYLTAKETHIFNIHLIPETLIKC